MNDICDKILGIIKKYIENIAIDLNQMDDDLSQLGMDSIAFIRIAVAIEELFEIEIPDEKLLITEMNTINKMIDVISTTLTNVQRKQ